MIVLIRDDDEDGEWEAPTIRKIINLIKSVFYKINIKGKGVETASHAGHCPINLVNVW